MMFQSCLLLFSFFSFFNFFDFFHFFHSSEKSENSTRIESTDKNRAVDDFVIPESWSNMDIDDSLIPDNWEKLLKKNSTDVIPREAFFKNPQVSQITISSDGKQIVFLKSVKGTIHLFTMDLASKKECQITTLDPKKNISQFCWGNNNRIVFAVEGEGKDFTSLYAVNRDGSNFQHLTNYKRNVNCQILDSLSDNEYEILMTMWDSSKQLSDVYTLDIYTGAPTLIETNPGNFTRWFVDAAGEIHLAQASTDNLETICYREKITDPWIDLMTFSWQDKIVPVGLSSDRCTFYYLSNRDQNTLGLYSLNLKALDKRKTLFHDKKWDISGCYWSSHSSSPIGVMLEKDTPQNYIWDYKWNSLALLMKEKFPGFHFLIVSADKQENQVILLSYSDINPPCYYLYNFLTDSLEKLYDVYPRVESEKLCPTRAISYSSVDKLTIPGYLTLPKDTREGYYPLMVHIHNGPEQRDTWGFNPMVQFFANRGYAVLQINYRGSEGFGKKYLEAGYKKWDRIQEDIAAGVQWAIGEGIAHPKYIGLYGEGFGGLSVLANLEKHPNFYALGIDFYGQSNVFSILERSCNEEVDFEKIGDPVIDREYLTGISPVFKAEMINCPLLVIQGQKEKGVDVDYSQALVSELKRRGIDAQLILKEDDSCATQTESNRLVIARQMEIFLRKHLGGYYWDALEASGAVKVK